MAETLSRSYSLEKSSNNGEVVTSGTLTTWENSPVSLFDVGDTFSPIPDGPVLTVRKVNITDKVIGINAGEFVRQWQISVEGDNSLTASGSSSSLPNDELSVSYELNGTTARTVDGDFIALRRSLIPIKRTSITVCSDSQEALTIPGNTYETYGTVVSENIVKETIKKDNVIVRTYYKHTIEAEA